MGDRMKLHQKSEVNVCHANISHVNLIPRAAVQINQLIPRFPTLQKLSETTPVFLYKNIFGLETKTVAI